MAILIDGYNLLNATGIDGRGTAGRTDLERSRVALLNFLASALTSEERAMTTIVFDSKQSPPGLPSELTHADMEVRFARGYPSADDLIEELIAADNVPRKLVVVSSDHRLHKAARRRRAKAFDSDAWMGELEQRGGSDSQVSIPSPASAGGTQPVAGTNWLAEFDDVDVAAIEAEIKDEVAGDEAKSTNDGDRAAAKKSRKTSQKSGIDNEAADSAHKIFPPDFFDDEQLADEAKTLDEWNPFPPGYGADVDDGDDR